MAVKFAKRLDNLEGSAIRELLKLTQLSISEISNAVGYANPLHFSRAFKNVYGESPRIWRQNHRT